MAENNIKFQEAFADHQEDLAKDGNFEAVFHSAKASYTTRPQQTREQYEQYRPNEIIPKGNTQEDQQAIMSLCKDAYERVGVVRSVIDMMSEFAAEGVTIIHPDSGPNKFYQAWMQKIDIEDRVERFLNWAYKSGNVVVRRRYATLEQEQIRRMREAVGLPVPIENIKPQTIPMKYTFYNPATVTLVGDAFGALSEEPVYALKVDLSAVKGIRTARTEVEKKVFQKLPEDLQKAIEGKPDIKGHVLVEIPSDSIHVNHYKKDDTDIWAKSFIYSILADIFYNDKLKLTKTATLDNMINAVRLWKLGDHTQELLPTPGTAAKLAGILEQHGGGGPMDVIWDSAISYEQYYPPLQELVNFEENHHEILLGLGVPEGLVGGSTQKGNMSANVVGLKNFIKRLEAGRRMVRQWLEEEITIIQTAMGFRKRPYIRFANNDLHDERVYFQLLMQMIDRNIISDERVLEIIREIPELEKIAVTQEEVEREKGIKPPKASPYHNPQLELEQEKANQDNSAIPNEENEKKDKGTKDDVEAPNGRPPGSKDTVPRKRGPNKAPAIGSLFVEATRIYDVVDHTMTKALLEQYELTDVRKLTSEQKKILDQMKTEVFVSVPPYSETSEKALKDYYEKADQKLKTEFKTFYRGLVGELGVENVTRDQQRLLRISAYTQLWGIKSYEDLRN